MDRTMRFTTAVAAACMLLLALVALPLAVETVPTTKPEDVGLSSERLARINEMMRRHLAAGDLAGGVTLVARKGAVCVWRRTA